MNRNCVNNHGNYECIGCGVCAVVCPQKCITIKLSSDGFYRSYVNEEACTGCGLCMKVCFKFLEKSNSIRNCFAEKHVYGGWSKDVASVSLSSSGGVSHEFYKCAVRQGFKAMGAIYQSSDKPVAHKIVDNLDGLDAFRGSKYLQSYTAEAFKKLKDTEKYLIVGTPCQIHGLRSLIRLRNIEENFVLVDFFCHGIPSTNLWTKYVEYLKKRFGVDSVKSVAFRSKEMSTWQKNAMTIVGANGCRYVKQNAFQRDLFYKFFLSDCCLNITCYECPLRLDSVYSDIRIADFWGKCYKDNALGASLITVNTAKGAAFFLSVKDRLVTKEHTFEDLLSSQGKRFLSKRQYSEKVLGLLQTNKSLAQIYIRTIMTGVLFRMAKVMVKNLIQTVKGRKRCRRL